jgi:hypothetical protein
VVVISYSHSLHFTCTGELFGRAGAYPQQSSRL